jgi:hypothetical protein
VQGWRKFLQPRSVLLPIAALHNGANRGKLV